jgi:pSer/pThr/pTyr-binding forkhead associated (FHA) protein
MADFSDELDGYLKARTATQDQENRETAAANAAADALFGHTFAHPHPDGFHPTQDAPAFAQHPVTHMWHDATTGTFSYYDAGSETYIPVEGPVSPHPHPQQQQQQQQQDYHVYPAASYESPGSYHIDPYTGYPVDTTPAAGGQAGQNYVAPPESDATLRLCVLSSKILKVAGVILMDASGISFGRDRPLSGQGKRVRMIEMEISRFHGSIYLDRQQVVPEAQESVAYSHFDSTGTAGTPSVESTAVVATFDESSSTVENAVKGEDTMMKSVESDKAESTALKQEAESSTSTESQPGGKNDDSSLQDQDVSLSPTTIQNEKDQEAEDGEIPDSPLSAGARVMKDREQGEMSDEGEVNGGEEKQDTAKEQEEEQQRQYREYQRQLEEYQQYYQSMVPPVYIDTFQIIDCGSTHGTFLNGKRLSAAKTASHPFPLNHLDQLQLGSTVFEIHAHEEGRICGSCQVTDDNEIEVLDDKNQETDGAKAPGADAANGSNKNSPKLVGDIKLLREQERIDEMNRLRKKWAGPDRKATGKRTGGGGYHDGYGSSTSSPSSDYGASSGYIDRAAKRRQFNPDNSQPIRSGMPDYSSTPEAVSGFHVPVAKTNKGHAMLSKMGWKTGTGLGAARQGVIEPVQLLVADKKAGLGSKTIQSQGAAAISASQPPETQAEKARRKARERFAQLR